jgi:two-component system sensor histidine kinase UhpB
MAGCYACPVIALRRLSLFWRVFLVDAGVLAAGVLVLVLAPVTISSPVLLKELAALVAGLLVLILISLVLLRQTMRPLQSLTRTMREIDPLAPGLRVEVDGAGPDVTALAGAFNDMLDRLEGERRESGRMALSVQESERRRVARELHDGVGQTLTAMLLQIEGLAADIPEAAQAELEELRETARSGAEDVRRIARRLRPEALEELGLEAALIALATAASEQARIRVDRAIERGLALGGEEELVVYRVAQEALTNVARHAAATRAELTRGSDPDGDVVLRVADDGRGATPRQLDSSYGIRGMRERAILIGATCTVTSSPGRGTEVVLRIPGQV